MSLTPSGATTPSSIPSRSSTPQLDSHVDTFDPSLRLTIAIAAKTSTLLALTGRYPSSSKVDTKDADDAQEAEKELHSEQQRAKKMMQTTIDECTIWLGLLCKHLEIELGRLPDEPMHNEGLKEGVPVEKRFDIAFELVLVCLGLASIPAKEEDQHRAPPLLDYTSTSRTLLLRTCWALGIPTKDVEKAEKAIAQFLFFQLEHAENKKKSKGEVGGSEWDKAAAEKSAENKGKGNTLRWAATGAGFVLGGVAIGLTGGLAAPALAPFLGGTLGIAAFSGGGGAVLIGTLLGVGGGGLAGYRTHRRLKGLEEVSFEPIEATDVPTIPSLTATIVASGFLLDLKDSTEPWRETFEEAAVDAFALKADPKTFMEAGQALDKFVRSQLIKNGGIELIKRSALSALWAGVALPLTVFTAAGTLLDSDFSRCRDKAKKAGVLLAEILEKKIQGNRPCVLVGYGPGATIIFEALLELHRRESGTLIFSAILISLPGSPSSVSWAAARSVVSHRLVNCYSSNDYVLAIAARLYTLSTRVAGLQSVSMVGVENVDCSDLLGGHMELRNKVKVILDRVRENEEQIFIG